VVRGAAHRRSSVRGWPRGARVGVKSEHAAAAGERRATENGASPLDTSSYAGLIDFSPDPARIRKPDPIRSGRIRAGFETAGHSGGCLAQVYSFRV